MSSFEIADEIVSKRLYRSMLNKNRARLSARSYAYRDDIGPYDAIDYIRSDWRGESRLFVAEYDFSEFFDKISHEHVLRTMDSLELHQTPLERRLIERFLTVPGPYLDAAQKHAPAIARDAGVHLGTSISLFLANVAASPLDKALERIGVSFVRYADDTLIWSRDYDAICRAAEQIYALSDLVGAPINQRKSHGVRLLVRRGTRRAEIEKTEEVGFLSHSIGLADVGMQRDAIGRIKKKIDQLIFNNLLRAPLQGAQDLTRLGALDKDYVVLIWQLRRYLYGSMTENDVRRLEHGPMPPVVLSGALARHPLVDDMKFLRDLDEWISLQVWLALRKRATLLASHVATPKPWGVPRWDLYKQKAISSSSGDTVDLRLPAAGRMSRVVRRAVAAHGTAAVGIGADLYRE